MCYARTDPTVPGSDAAPGSSVSLTTPPRPEDTALENWETEDGTSTLD
jgi:hypothetical protein